MTQSIPQPSDDEVDLLLAEIDQIARNYDHHDYGLPTHDDDSVASMRAQVQWFFESWTRVPQPPAGQQDSEACLSKMADIGQQNGLYPEFETQGAAREPLTEEQIEKIGKELDGDGSAYPFFLAEKKKRVAMVRRVEAHFGIKAHS
jgi:hypothetical protein